jgi:hypothetical protein
VGAAGATSGAASLVRRVEAEGAPPCGAPFWAIASRSPPRAIDGIGIRALLDRQRVVEPGSHPPARGSSGSLSRPGLAVFAFLFCTALIGMLACRRAGRSQRPRRCGGVSIVLLTIVVSPHRPAYGCWRCDDADARVCSRWFSVYLAPLRSASLWSGSSSGSASNKRYSAQHCLWGLR